VAGKYRVALVTIDYPPQQRTSAAVQMRDLAEEMLRQGHEPTVIVPSSEIGPPWVLETLDGVEVLRIRARPTRDVGYVRRTINETQLAFLMRRGVAKSPLRDRKWDLIAWYSPTIFFGPLIWSIKRKSGAHAYLILRDLFPEWTVDLGLMRKHVGYWYFRMVANLQYCIADTIGVQTESNLAYMAAWAHRAGRSLEVLRNWQNQGPLRGSSIQFYDTALAGRNIFVYIGNMGLAQGIDVLVDLAASLTSRRDIGFAFIGRGSEVEKMKAKVALHKLDNTLFFDEVPSEEIPGLLAQCQAGLLALHPKHKSHNIPGKFLSYLNAGLPVVARVNHGTDLLGLINREGVGRAFVGHPVSEMKTFAIELCEKPEMHGEMATRALSLGKSMFLPDTAVRQIMAHAEPKAAERRP
jgi:glycosyltransferase involved in cell wall biosynthesis